MGKALGFPETDGLSDDSIDGSLDGLSEGTAVGCLEGLEVGAFVGGCKTRA